MPLAALNNNFPPTTLFHIQIIVTEDGFSTIPSKKDFVNLLGDCLSETATLFHRCVRPYSYPKLSSFLSETTRTSNLNEFMGINIKNSLSVSDDYILGIRKLKGAIGEAFQLISNYSSGF